MLGEFGNFEGRMSIADAMTAAHGAMEQEEQPIQTGFPQLDRILGGGLLDGKMTVIAASPSVDVTEMLLRMAVAVARAGKHVLFVSLRSSVEQIGRYLVSAASGVSVERLRSGDVPTHVWTHGLAAYGDAAHRVDIMSCGTLHVEDLAQDVAERHNRGFCDVLVLDHLQGLQTCQKGRSYADELGIISEGLGEIALDLDIPVLVAAQTR